MISFVEDEDKHQEIVVGINHQTVFAQTEYEDRMTEQVGCTTPLLLTALGSKHKFRSVPAEYFSLQSCDD